MRILFIVLCLLLSSCTVIEIAKAVKESSYYVFNEKEFEEKKKGVVFFAVRGGGSYHPFFLKKIGSKSASMELEGKEGSIRYRDYIYKYIVLESGFYYLDKVIVETDPYSIFYLPTPGLKNNKLVYGGFEVKGGEVLNIGLLEVSKKKETFEIIEETEKIKQDLEKRHHPEFIQKLKRGKFFMPGSSAVVQDGKFVLIDKEETKKNFLVK